MFNDYVTYTTHMYRYICYYVVCDVVRHDRRSMTTSGYGTSRAERWLAHGQAVERSAMQICAAEPEAGSGPRRARGFRRPVRSVRELRRDATGHEQARRQRRARCTARHGTRHGPGAERSPVPVGCGTETERESGREPAKN